MQKFIFFFLIFCINIFPQQKNVKLSVQSLKNATYYIILADTTVKLKNGNFTLEKRDEEGLLIKYLSVDLAEDQIATGDIDGDGDEDAVVILISSGGGSGAFYEVAVMLNDNGKPRYLTGEFLGDRIKLNFVKILSDRSILIDMIVHGPKDSQCCPTLPKTQRYKITGGKLQIIK